MTWETAVAIAYSELLIFLEKQKHCGKKYIKNIVLNCITTPNQYYIAFVQKTTGILLWELLNYILILSSGANNNSPGCFPTHHLLPPPTNWRSQELNFLIQNLHSRTELQFFPRYRTHVDIWKQTLNLAISWHTNLIFHQILFLLGVV